VRLRDISSSIGELVEGKQLQYGDAVGKSGKILAILYPNGVQPYQYDDVLLTVRVLDKLSRISQRGPDGKDLGGESPWKDIAGYGILGTRKDTDNQTGPDHELMEKRIDDWAARFPARGEIVD
jgi:hypothetical protein